MDDWNRSVVGLTDWIGASTVDGNGSLHATNRTRTVSYGFAMVCLVVSINCSASCRILNSVLELELTKKAVVRIVLRQCPGSLSEPSP